MSKFDYMGFGYDGGSDDMFVAHAKKYSAAEAVEICKQENDYGVLWRAPDRRERFAVLRKSQLQQSRRQNGND